MYADGGCGDGELRTAGCGYLWRYRDRGEEAVEGGGVELFEARKLFSLKGSRVVVEVRFIAEGQPWNQWQRRLR